MTQGLLEALGWAPQASSRADARLLAQLLPLLGIEALVVDDAQLLSAPGFDVLRQLQDVADIGLVFCGPFRMWPKLRERCPELAHRVVAIHELAAVDRSDAMRLVNDAPALEGRKDLSDVVHVLLNATGGNVGRMLQVLEEARHRSRRAHRPLSVPLLDRVLGELERLHQPSIRW